MTTFNDYFGESAQAYARYRPHYPTALFDWLRTVPAGRARAWDCGTGSGQAAVGLVGQFDEVIASDASEGQLGNADRASAVAYVAMEAEESALSDRSVDLVTVAQALHWFDRRRFFAEVDRVLRPGGALAVWSYGLVTVDPPVDAHIDHLYHHVLGPYWPRERALVDSGYAGVVLPYPELPDPGIAMEAEWALAEFAGYVSSWSAVGRYRAAGHDDPVGPFVQRVADEWGATRRRIRWPLVVRAGRKSM